MGADRPGPGRVRSSGASTCPTDRARPDKTVTLLDMGTGREVCAPLRLPRRPGPMAVTGDGDLVVGFGSDVARLRPPAR